MQYREAKHLHNGDQVIAKKDNAALIVKSIEVYGSIKTVRINVVDEFNNYFAILHTQVK